MTYKLDEVLTMLDQVLMRLDRIEKLINFDNELEPTDVDEQFEKIFKRSPKKPALKVVKNEPPNNIIEFSPNE